MNNIEPEPINDPVLEDGKENENSAQTLHVHAVKSTDYRLQITDYRFTVYSYRFTDYTLHVQKQHDYPGYRGTYSRSKQTRFV